MRILPSDRLPGSHRIDLQGEVLTLENLDILADLIKDFVKVEREKLLKENVIMACCHSN